MFLPFTAASRRSDYPRRLLSHVQICLTPTHKFLVAFLLLAALMPLGPMTAFAEPDTPQRGLAHRIMLPLVGGRVPEPEAVTGETYSAIPVLEPPTDRDAAAHGDLNLALRGYAPAYESGDEALRLVYYGGDTDGGAPQMPGIFADGRTPTFTSGHRVYQWDWGCSADGCRGSMLRSPDVTLLGLGTRPGELVRAPARGDPIYSDGNNAYKALVLYADDKRITLKYTQNDNVREGYTVHLEGLKVDVNLLRLYRQNDAAGRETLPGLRDNQAVGLAAGNEVLVAIRDCGSFMDPRSQKDWWQGR